MYEKPPITHSKTIAFANTLMDNLFCVLCDIYLLDSEEYKKHKETHREKNEGPYKCDKCDSGFYEKTRLMHHYNNHLDASLSEQIIVPQSDPAGFFQCTVCKFPFNRLANYQRHYQRIHIQASTSCDECDFSTTNDSEGLKGHKLRKHPV